MEKVSDSIKILTSRVELLQEDFSKLQTFFFKNSTPWYKSASTIISITALLFSFGTTYLSYKHTENQDMQNARSELRGMIQRLAILPKENFELTQKYIDNPANLAFLSGYINQENILLARQAAEIVRELPDDRVSSTEYYAIALAFQNSYNLEETSFFLQEAIKKAEDFNNEIAALRTYANFLFLTGQPESGRVEYQKALNTFSRYKGYNDYIQRSTHIWTELSWSLSEANTGFTSAAEQHITNAENILSNLPQSSSTEQLQKQINQTKSLIMSGQVSSKSNNLTP